MPNNLVSYQLNNGIAVIQLDDGKRNALSPAMFSALNKALDRAEADKAIVILTGRDTVFSAGFDLKVMKAGGVGALSMLRSGYIITARLLAYPYPVITACNGHVLAMGVFVMLSSDYIIGSRGDFKVSANEVAIGLTMPRVAAALLRHRLTPAAFQRAATLSEYFPVEQAREAGFFDELVEPDQLLERAKDRAAEFAKLDMTAHTGTKRRIRADVINYVKKSVRLDVLDAAMMGVRGAKPKSRR